MMVDKRTFVLGVLSLMALVLIVANIMAPRGAVAADTIKDNDYQLQTGRVTNGGEALYVTDNRTGVMAAYSYNPNIRGLQLIAQPRPVQASFGGGGPMNRRR